MPQPGTLIEGKYEILGKIHEGGMGTIYKVRHRLLDEIRVVKVMKPSITADEEMKSRFAEEAKMATRLKHPNIGTIHDFALDDDGTAYLVMEYIDGVNLAELLHSKGPPGTPLVLEIAHQALLALGYLHRRNVIHRDIAPDNLMFTQDEDGSPRVKLIDLGIAKALDRPVDLTSTGVFLGKLKYASPEQYGALPAGEKLDGRSDLYCLGVVIYELLTETRPFEGETPAELLRAHLFSPPIPFEQSDPEGKVPPEVRRLVLKALEKKREDRFATAEEFDREVVALRPQYPDSGTIDNTVQILSTARHTPGVTHAQTITPSAQNRLDRQFVGGTTPSAASRPELSSVPTRVVDGKKRTTALDAPRPLRRGGRGLWIAGGAAAAIVVALLLGRPWGTRRAVPAPVPTAVPIAPTAAPPAESSAAQPTVLAPTAPAPTAAPAEPTPRPRATPQEASSDRADAEQARLRAVRARASAERAGSAEKAAGTFELGRRAEGEGNRFLARKRFSAAAASFEKSAETFAAAESQALQSKKAAADTAVPIPTARPEPTRAPTAVALVVPPTPIPAAPEPTRAPVGEQERIREAIRRYEKAQSNLDADLYARVFPGADKARIRSAFADLRSQSVEISVQRIDVAPGGNSAVVYGYETRSFAPRVGSEQHVSGNRVFHLEKRGDSWVITGLGS